MRGPLISACCKRTYDKTIGGRGLHWPGGRELQPPLVYRIQMQCIRRRYTLPVLEPGIDLQWKGYFGGGVMPRLRISA